MDGNDGYRKKVTFWLAAVLPLLVAAGSGAAPAGRGTAGGSPDKGAAEAGAPAASSYEHWRNQPDEPYTDGEASFQRILTVLRTKYVDEGLTDDDFYRAASRGLLQYADPARDAWNKLLTPTEYAELIADLNGQVVGVGLEFSFESESGMGLVLSALPGTPAEAAGLKTGDRILQVDGHSFAGKQMRDMVYAIRGKVGTPVALTILREATVFTAKLTRSKINWDSVDATMLDHGTGVVSIRSFAKATPERVRTGLQALEQKGLKALIVDLRRCPGGSFTSAVATTSLFLPDGATVVRLKERDGTEDAKTASGEPVIADVPISVLISGTTASGCELLAASLKQNLGATLVGSRSFGKWSIQSVDELPNHYAMKYTVASFYPPDGQDLSGKGLTPDVPVAAAPDEARLQRESVATRLGADPVLQAAQRLLQRGG